MTIKNNCSDGGHHNFMKYDTTSFCSELSQGPHGLRSIRRRPQSSQLNAKLMMKNSRNPETDTPEIYCNEDQVNEKQEENFHDEQDAEKENEPWNLAFFAENSTFHGVNHIVTPGRFTLRKAAWACAFFSSLGIFLNQAYDRYGYYRSNPHVTKLDEQEAVVIDFPAITICNVNSFRLSQLTTDDFYYAGQDIFGIFNSDYSLKEIKYRDNKTWPYVQRKIEKIIGQRDDYKPTNTNFDMHELYDRTGHLLFGMIKNCKYRGDTCMHPFNWTVVFTRYGKCYTFNSGKDYLALETLKGGIDNGLEILLDTQQDEYMPVWDETDEISVEAGFKVQLHIQDEPPFIHELGFGISPGFQTLVATQEQRITFLPSPYGNCSNGKDESKHFHFEKYSISACRITCETEFVFANCQCRMVHMPGDTRPFCSPELYKKCADKALDYLVQKDQSTCVCDTPCNVTRYNLQMSSLQLPNTQALSYLAYKYNRSEEYVRNNLVKLNIFFEALNYETIEQKIAYEIPGLFGDIGGQMGLFIGASILTVLELFDYLYEVIKDKTWGRKLRKAKSVASSDVTAGENLDKAEAEGEGRYRFPPASNHYLGLCEFQTLPSSSYIENPISTQKFQTLPPPRTQEYFGHSSAASRINQQVDVLPMEPKLRQMFHPVRSRGLKSTREMSMSYNDIHHFPEGGWKNQDFPHVSNRIASRCFPSTVVTSPNGPISSNPVADVETSTVNRNYCLSTTFSNGDERVRISPNLKRKNLQRHSQSIETAIH